MVKVAAILVDYLRITSNGLKIEKSEIYSQFQIPR